VAKSALMHVLIVGIMFFQMLILPTNVVGQHSFGIELDYVTGFQDQPLQIWDDTIDFSIPHGSQLTFSFSKRIPNSKWLLTSGLGAKYLNTRGETSSQLKFTTNSFNINALIGTRYSVSKKFDIGLQFMIETNRNMSETTFLKANLWRYYLALESAYHLNEKWLLVCKYSRSLSPNEDAYLLFIPPNQLSLGMQYHFNEL
jgi:hypothetical protein